MVRSHHLFGLLACVCIFALISALGPACAPNLSQGDGGLRFCNTSDDCTKQLGKAFVCRLHLCQRISTCSGEGQPCEVKGKEGPCAKGTSACEDGELICRQVIQPKDEVCGNNIDDNCDGKIDESPPCSCSPGQERPCFEGGVGCSQAPNNPGVWQCTGTCQAGRQTCTPNQTWGVCIGIVAPDIETCDGKDNDCDGKIDGDKIPGVGGLCGVLGKQGPCATGTTVCTKGKIECEQTVQPKTEICDGKDNDCNGAIDDHPDCKCTAPQTQECYNADEKTVGVGPCKKGTQDCDSNGKWGPCKDQILPTPEICDGIDNDCNGQIDETFLDKGKACTDPTRKGECAAGTLACEGGKEVCKQNVQPTPTEECDGKDGNCNGKTDLEDGCTCINGTTQACYTGPANTRNVGNCSDGSQLCINGKWDVCKGDVKPVAETCGNDGKDEDCDGQINEQPPCTCIAGATQKCGSDKGECKQGTQTCGNDGTYGPCVGEVKGTAEICDNKDNDCDGMIDEDFPTLGQVCNASAQGECRTQGVFICRNNKAECNAVPGTPGTETCNNKDDNCDGQIDEGVTQPCYTGATGTQGVGECKDGIQTCAAGVFGACIGEVTPVPEIANGKDDNCNGQIDEGLSGCQDQSEDQVFTANSMVGCDCATEPCDGNTAKALCGGGWHICNLTEWKARRNNVVPLKFRHIAAKMTCTLDDPCPCVDQNGNNCTGTIVDATTLCEASCFVSGKQRYWPFFVGPTNAGATDDCTSRFTNWTPVKGHFVGRSRTTSARAHDSSNTQAECLGYNESLSGPRVFAQGVMCCK